MARSSQQLLPGLPEPDIPIRLYDTDTLTEIGESLSRLQDIHRRMDELAGVSA